MLIKSIIRRVASVVRWAAAQYQEHMTSSFLKQNSVVKRMFSGSIMPVSTVSLIYSHICSIMPMSLVYYIVGNMQYINVMYIEYSIIIWKYVS